MRSGAVVGDHLFLRNFRAQLYNVSTLLLLFLTVISPKMSSLLLYRSLLLLTIIGSTFSTPIPGSQSSFFSCLSNAGLNYISSSSSSYNGDIAAYNQRLQPQPVAVVYPANSNLVAAAVNCARQAGVAVAARGGGHSYVILLHVFFSYGELKVNTLN